MIYRYKHVCGEIVLVDSDEYPDFFDPTKLAVALVAPCPQHGCDEPIIIGVEDIGKTLLSLPLIKFDMRWEAD